MMHKVAGMVAFMVLCCILAEAQEYRDRPAFSKDPIGPLVWDSVHHLRKGNTYLTLGWDSDQPIEITSKKVSSRNISKKVIFEGNVKVKQGEVTLTCDRLVIVYDEKTGRRPTELPTGLENASQIKSITASGNVKIVQNERMVIADEALYDNVKSSIILKGGPAQLWDGKEELNGGQIIINRDLKRRGPAVEPIRNRK
jgi:lipopolysaccharide transport protein LptA